MQKIIVFGTTEKSQELRVYIESEKQAEVCAFVVDGAYKVCDELRGLPVVALENAVDLYPPEEYKVLLVIGYSNMNRNRRKKFTELKQLGYTMFTYISEKANVYADGIGEGCILFPGCTVGAFVSLGQGNILSHGAVVCHNTCAGDFNFFASGATILGCVTISDNCFLGAGCVIGSRLTVAEYTLIAAGTTLMKNTQDHQVYFPAKAILWHGTSNDINI